MSEDENTKKQSGLEIFCFQVTPTPKLYKTFQPTSEIDFMNMSFYIKWRFGYSPNL